MLRSGYQKAICSPWLLVENKSSALLCAATARERRKLWFICDETHCEPMKYYRQTHDSAPKKPVAKNSSARWNVCIFAFALIISNSYYDFIRYFHLFIATYARGWKASHKFVCRVIYLFVITFSFAWSFASSVPARVRPSQRKWYRWNFPFSTDSALVPLHSDSSLRNRGKKRTPAWTTASSRH